MGNTDSPVGITFLWHMHQPMYINPQNGYYLLPWVRLHAIKDYYDMASFIEAVPEMRAVVNFVPSLLFQLEEYRRGTAHDLYLECSLKPVSHLASEDKLFLIKHFFTVNRQRKIDPAARYRELWQKRAQANGQLEKALHFFSAQDYLDLQVLFNLAWCGPTLKKDAEVARLVAKDRGFTQKEKELLIAKQKALIGKILPLYTKLQDCGQVEVSVSPFYHPLLPLVCDNYIAREAQPGVALPRNRFSYPDDAEEQIRRALEYTQKLFGKKPQGMWPPEGAVSNKVLELAIQQEIRWLATDETILRKSLAANSDLPAEKLYSSYTFKNQRREVSLFFRNQSLSNLISFVYSSWDEEEAASDLFQRLLAERNRLGKNGEKYIISIIMDGENAWEYFPNGGETFLPSLYQKIAASREFKPMTFSSYLSQVNKKSQVPFSAIASGSWIDGNFSTWIGEQAKNEAWDYLFQARKTLKEWVAHLTQDERKKSHEIIERAANAIHIAEGSDWFWWLRSGEQPESERKFSILFKLYLAEMYRILGLEIPPHLRPSGS